MAILLASFPRSGNTWVRSILWSYFDETDLTASEYTHMKGGVEYKGRDPEWEENALLVKTHGRGGGADKVVVLVRHPYDSLWSFAHFHRDHNPHAKPFHYADEAAELCKFLYFYRSEYPENKKLVISYEVLHHTPLLVFQNLFRFLGRKLDEEKFLLAYENNRIEKYKVNGSPNIVDAGLVGNRPKSGKMPQLKTMHRKGIIGEGFEELSKELKLLIKNATKSEFNKIGYFMNDEDW